MDELVEDDSEAEDRRLAGGRVAGEQFGREVEAVPAILAIGDVRPELDDQLIEVLDVEVAEEDVAGRVAVVDAPLGLLLDLLNHLYHHQRHVHVPLLLVAVLGVDELPHSHLAAVVGGKPLVLARLAHSRGGTAELLALLSAQRAFQWRGEAFLVGARLEAWAFRAADHAALDILHYAYGLLEARLVCGGLEPRFLGCLDFLPRDLQLNLQFLHSFSQALYLNQRGLVLGPELFDVSLEGLDLLLELDVSVDDLSLLRQVEESFLFASRAFPLLLQEALVFHSQSGDFPFIYAVVLKRSFSQFIELAFNCLVLASQLHVFAEQLVVLVTCTAHLGLPDGLDLL